jgi:hypothetical protein
LENLRLFPLPNFLMLADIGDFYLNRYSPYFNPKFDLVSRALRRVPGFDPAVLVKDLSDVAIKGPMTILSIMLMTSMLNPFSYMIPTIFALIAVQNQNTFNDLDKEAVQTQICPMIVDMTNEDVDVRRDVVTRLAANTVWVKDQWGLYVRRPLAHIANAAQNKWNKTDNKVKDTFNTADVYQETVNKWERADKFVRADGTYVDAQGKPIEEEKSDENVQPASAVAQDDSVGWPSSGVALVSKSASTHVFITTCHRFEEIPYTMDQLMMFMRFTTNRLTPTEAKLLNITEEQRTMRPELTLEDLETTGLMIGSITLTQSEQGKIKVENTERTKQFITKLGRELGSTDDWVKITEDVTSADQTNPPLVAYVALTTGASFEEAVDQRKFEHIKQRILKLDPTHTNRVVLFSQFDTVLSNFKTYCSGAQRLKIHRVGDPFDGGITKASDQFNFSAKEDPNNIHILMLSKSEADGFDGLQDVGLMIIMEPCTTDSMKRQLIARVVRQRAHTKSRTVNIYEYVSTPGFLNIQKVYASMADWWTHDKRVAPWVFKPLLSQARTPDQIVVSNQMVSGEMEDLCQGNHDQFEKGLINKFNKDKLWTQFKTWSFGKANDDELEEIEKRLQNEHKDLTRWHKWQQFRNARLNPGK